MKITTDIDKGRNLRCHKVDGTIDVGELKNTLSSIYSAPEFDQEMDVIWDLRTADLSKASLEQIQLLAGFVGNNWGTSGQSKAALVVSDDLAYGLSRIYGSLLDGKTDSSMQIFKDIDEAYEWIEDQQS